MGGDVLPGNAAANHRSVAASGDAPKPLSCTICRQRKVKCNKVHPCGPCVKSGHECIFPQRVRVPRAKPTASRTRDSELLRRIGRLESLVSRVDAAKALMKDQVPLDDAVRTERVDRSALGTPTTKEPFIQNPEPGNLTESFASYIKVQESGSRFWASLGTEVEGLRRLLESQLDDDNDVDGSDATPPERDNNYNSPGFLFNDGRRLSAVETDVPQPSSLHRTTLVRNYFDNVHPCCHVIHKPTVSMHLLGSTDLFESTSGHYKFNSIEALSFSLYFAAVTSMSDEECIRDFSENRNVLLARYKHGCEVSLAQADFLNSMEIVTLTAFVIYLTAARASNSARSVWTLVGLAVRIAQSLSLHRDGDGTHFSAFEAEMRRRLWWQIIVIDMRAAEDRGTEAIIADSSFDTKTPCNLNDEDFSFTSQRPLVERHGITEMSFTLMTAEVSNVLKTLNTAPLGSLSGFSLSEDEKERQITSSIKKIENLYNGGMISSETGTLSLPVVLGKLLSMRLWAALRYPLQKQKTGAAMSMSPGDGLRTVVSILELVMMIDAHPDAVGFQWYFRTWVPWHPVAIALAELCGMPHGELADKAWPVVEKGFHLCSGRVADSKEGMLWKPIKRLYRRARAIRDGTSRTMSESVSSTPANATRSQTIVESPQRNLESNQPPFQTGLSLPQMPPTSGIQGGYQPEIVTNVGYGFQNQLTFGLDWAPTFDMNMTGVETYGGPINWDDWNDFVFDVGSISQNTNSAIYNDQAAANMQMAAGYWPNWNPQA